MLPETVEALAELAGIYKKLDLLQEKYTALLGKESRKPSG